jgi:hypothetical protein
VLKTVASDEQRRMLARWLAFSHSLPAGAPPAALLAARLLRAQ